MKQDYLLKPGDTILEKKVNYYIDLANESLMKYGKNLFDFFYPYGKWLTKATNAVIPWKKEKRDYAIRTAMNKLLDGEKLSAEEETSLSFQASGVKTAYGGAAGSLIASGASKNPIFLVLGATVGGLGLLHQSVMLKKLENIMENLSDKEKKTLKEAIENMDTYQMRDAIYETFLY